MERLIRGRSSSGTVCQLQKGTVANSTPLGPFLSPAFPPFFPAKTLCGPDPFPPRHRTRLLSLYKHEVRFPADGSSRLQRPLFQTRGRGGWRERAFCDAAFVVLSAKVIPRSTVPSFPLSPLSLSVSPLRRPPSPFSGELIGDGCGRCSIGN